MQGHGQWPACECPRCLPGRQKEEARARETLARWKALGGQTMCPEGLHVVDAGSGEAATCEPCGITSALLTDSRPTEPLPGGRGSLLSGLMPLWRL